MNHLANSASCLDDVVLSGELPPLVLIAFTRPELLKEVLNGISQQSLLPPKIIAFVDGARGVADKPLIEQNISLLKQFSSSIPVDIVARTKNLGCDQNVIRGLTEVLSSHESVVYLEDDTIPNSYFYDRMCRLLQVYREDKKVSSVSAYASLPAELDLEYETDFMVSHRVFCWGFGTWSDRWQEFDLANKSSQYNPFGSFYKIPVTSQTKMTIVNQFWLEKNKKTDWVITFTVAALYHQKIHIVPTSSFTYNIGFGHSQSKTYKGEEQSWVNAKYDANFYPNTLPSNLEPLCQLGIASSNINLAQYLLKCRGVWLNPSAFLYLLKSADSLRNIVILLIIFLTRFPIMLRRWLNGFSI